MVSTAAFHARVRVSVPGRGGLKKTNIFLPHPLLKLSIMGSLCDRKVACWASDLQGLNFISCVWRAVSSHSSHHLILRRFSWPNLAGMCTKVAWSPIHILIHTIHNVHSDKCRAFFYLSRGVKFPWHSQIGLYSRANSWKDKTMNQCWFNVGPAS